MVYTMIEPWFVFCPEKQSRFRPGWAARLGNMAKRRTQLLKDPNPDLLRQEGLLDKEIKKEFRKHFNKIRTQPGDALNSGNLSHQIRVMKRAVSLS